MGIMVLVEKWYSREHYQKYHVWRTETGVIDKIRSPVMTNQSRREVKLLADFR